MAQLVVKILGRLAKRSLIFVCVLFPSIFFVLKLFRKFTCNNLLSLRDWEQALRISQFLSLPMKSSLCVDYCTSFPSCIYCSNNMIHLLTSHLTDMSSSSGKFRLSPCVVSCWYCSKNRILSIIQFITAEGETVRGKRIGDDFGTQCDRYLLASYLHYVFPFKKNNQSRK